MKQKGRLVKYTSLKNKVKGAVSYSNRRCFSANGFSLLPLALRPRLFLIIMIGIVCSATCTLFTNLNDTVFATVSSLSLTISDSILSLDLKPISANGTFASSNDLTISANTNNYTGYTLKIATSNSESVNLVDTSGNSFASIESAVKESVFAGDDVSYNNKWGYAPSQYYDSISGVFLPNNNQYFPAPPTMGDLLGVTNVANSSSAAADNDNYTIAIGARANTSTKASTYEGTFVITAVANATPYTITFDPNTAETVTNMPGDPISSSSSTSISDSTYAETIALPNTVPERRGYNFLGWCNTQPTRTNGKDICSSTTYNPGGEGTSLSYILNQTSDNTNINLYAMWNGPLLYYKVADMVKTYDNNGQPRTQTAEDLRVTLTRPTSNNPATDTSNSGVFLYDSAVFGEASDASNDYPIYYYRGILDNTFASTDSQGGIGSSGDGYYYPNYVRLGDTCWRIVRTTGSGGTKMIYNGSWSGGTTTNSCANATSNAQYGTSPINYNNDSNISRYSILSIGYTYNSTYKSTETDTAAGVLFGTSTDYSGNAVDSTIKQRVEQQFFGAISGYESSLEPSAGYCNDRSIYNSGGVLLTDNSIITTPYNANSSAATYYFGGQRRNDASNNSRTLSLKCPREIVDLYTTNFASDGNKQLKKPVALLSVDEISLAGSGSAGSSGQGSRSSVFNLNSYLRSGSTFWTLSPSSRVGNLMLAYYAYAIGGSSSDMAYGGQGVRPVVSLKHEVIISSGSGTAVDPWVINAP